ncbi:restriction endonuclease subunit S [Geobacter sp. DSM 9736]|uniref:restriction endonuclease subunit S n=1 Tax=Geobacter sp. DSM 9736 TaxID=1277350 RepID=UPI000B5011FC|nr:restriction endonuclease subunit S [Geobacter sp. DSM 9736]SNB45222.1 type I restriction enzyme, S subunit [Geobacter sp. DSM 9736]
MELKPGYKQTEIGVIPKDWDVLPLQDACRVPITYGIVQCGPHIPNGVPYIRVSDMDRSQLDVSGMMRTSFAIATQFGRSTVEENDIVYALRGALGEVRLISREVAGANLTQGTARIAPKNDLAHQYLLWAMRSSNAVQQSELTSKGTTFREITLADLRQITIPLPPTKAEQEAIAEALTDADALIESLEQLVVKKRQIKQGAMQELLTGKKRLPGFSESWQIRPLGEIAPLQRGFDLPNSELQQGPYPVVYSNGVLNRHTMFKAKGPGVVTGRSGTIGAVTFVPEDFWPHNTALWVTSFKGNDPKFIFYLYTRIGLERFATGSGVPTLNRNDVHAFKVKVPSTKEEQTAIATILSDMDTEIDALEEKLTKARQIKQGMMQELLTGRIRLV